MEHDEILKVLRKIDVLPTFPTVVAEIVSIINDPMSSAGDLAKSMDPSMASEVLRIANTAYFGTRSFRKITSMEHAIAIIGLEHLSQIILHMPFLTMIQGDAELERERFIRHSMICALASKVISQSLNVGDQHAVYLGGLMHDIGTIIIYRHFNPQWKLISGLVRDKGHTWIDAEKEILSCDHGMIGGCLLMMWNLPQSVTDGVVHHHFPQNAADNIWNARIIDIGNRFAKQVDLGDQFVNFDEFVEKNRFFVSLVEELGIEVSLARELDLFDSVYGLMKNARSLIIGAGEEQL